MYQRGDTGGLTAAELDGYVKHLERMRVHAWRDVGFDRGMAAGLRLAVDSICGITGWHCSHDDCPEAALLVDSAGHRWCEKHAPAGELTIAEHDDFRAVDE